MRPRFASAFWALAFAAPCLGQTGPTVTLRDTVDRLHPSQFVRIMERTRAGKIIPIFDPRSGTRHERTAAEVDRRSRILIRFDRQHVADTTFEGLITVTAHSGTTPVEVPGYFVVGTRQDTAAVQVRSAQDLGELLGEIRHLWERIDREAYDAGAQRLRGVTDITQPQAQAQAIGITEDSVGNIRQHPAFDSLNRAVTRAFSIHQNLTRSLDSLRSEQQRDSIRRAELVRDSLAAAETARTTFRTDIPTLEDGMRIRADSIRARSRREEEAKGRLNELRDRLGREVDRALDTIPKREALNRIAADTAILVIPLRSFADSASLDLVDALATAANRQQEVLRSLAREAANRWLPQLSNRTLSVDERWDAYQHLIANVEVLASLAMQIRPLLDQVRAILLARLIDSDILLADTKLRPGDPLVITIANRSDARSAPRILRVRIEVAEFGLLQGVDDSFIFLKRLGVDPNANQVMVNAAKQVADTTGAAMSVETAQPVNYTPAPGATLRWTWRPRNGFGRFLEPGWGVNVSFPNFGSTITEFSSSSPTDPASTPSVTVRDGGGPVDITIGFVGSLFGGLVQATFGWDLTVSEKRQYFGLGFSFVQLGNTIDADGGG